MPPEELSVALRETEGEYLSQRRAIAALDFVAAGALGVVALWQLGIVKHIPEPPPKSLFDAPKVNGSAEAYSYWGIPDAFLGVASYAVTATLAAAGSPARARTAPYYPLAMAAKTIVDAAQAGKLTYDSWTKYRAFCMWCLIAAGATFATVPLALAEAKAALKTVTAS